MIAQLRGRLLSKTPNQAIVDTGGVGYDVNIPVYTFTKLPGDSGYKPTPKPGDVWRGNFYRINRDKDQPDKLLRRTSVARCSQPGGVIGRIIASFGKSGYGPHERWPNRFCRPPSQ